MLPLPVHSLPILSILSPNCAPADRSPLRPHMRTHSQALGVDPTVTAISQLLLPVTGKPGVAVLPLSGAGGVPQREYGEGWVSAVSLPVLDSNRDVWTRMSPNNWVDVLVHTPCCCPALGSHNRQPVVVLALYVIFFCVYTPAQCQAYRSPHRQLIFAPDPCILSCLLMFVFLWPVSLVTVVVGVGNYKLVHFGVFKRVVGSVPVVFYGTLVCSRPVTVTSPHAHLIVPFYSPIVACLPSSVLLVVGVGVAPPH